MDTSDFAKIPGWLAPLMLAASLVISLIYIALVIARKNERCPHCGTSNPVQARTCRTAAGARWRPRRICWDCWWCWRCCFPAGAW